MIMINKKDLVYSYIIRSRILLESGSSRCLWLLFHLFCLIILLAFFLSLRIHSFPRWPLELILDYQNSQNRYLWIFRFSLSSLLLNKCFRIFWKGCRVRSLSCCLADGKGKDLSQEGQVFCFESACHSENWFQAECSNRLQHLY